MSSEHNPLVSMNNAQHFEIANHVDSHPAALGDTTLNTADSELDRLVFDHNRTEQQASVPKRATIFQTSLNIAKLCMGTGTLALPFAAQQGGLVFNAIGLGVIVVWNYYSADCLLRCLDYLPRQAVDSGHISSCNTTGYNQQEQSSDSYGATENVQTVKCNMTMPGPPEGTTTCGAVAWYAFGKPGLVVLDLLMIMLFVGLLTSYEAAMISFMDGIHQSEWCRVLPGLIVAILSSAEDISFLSRFSAFGLIALAFSFGIISWQGFIDNGWVDMSDTLQLNLWPESLSAASSWFGVVVFGYGIVPVIFNINDSMANPTQIKSATKIGLSIAYVGYLMASNGIRVLFSRTHSFDGDVLQALPPDSPISLAVRLMMSIVVAVTAPFIVVPCGELIEGKLGVDSRCARNRIVIRTILCAGCTLLAVFVPGFVHIISFVGCFCVSATGFVLPPLFHFRLSEGNRCLRDTTLLILGLVTTCIASAITFRNLANKVSTQTIMAGDHMI